MPQRYLLIMISFAFSLILYIDRSAISVVKEPMAESLAFSDKQMGWVFAAFAFAYALGQIPGGLMADKYGPRKTLSLVAILWSVFTALTGVVKGFVPMVTVRALFGLGEAGAYPTMARAFYAWLPTKERGLTHGLNFSGGRIGAAVSFPLCVWLLSYVSWYELFWVLGAAGIVLTAAWWAWFRDDPADHPRMSADELAVIRQDAAPDAGSDAAPDACPDASPDAANGTPAKTPPLPTTGEVFRSANVWLLMGQYVCSNFTFFFMLSWSFTYLRRTYDLSAADAAFYNMLALLAGAVGNWVAGGTIDTIYRRGHWVGSRRTPAVAGFALASAGMALAINVDSVVPAVCFIALAVFGADMTLSPSWSTCNDVGRGRSGLVSGAMNMTGNLGSALVALAFPFLLAWGTRQGFEVAATPFFYTAAALNFVAIVLWLFIRPDRPVVAQTAAGNPAA